MSDLVERLRKKVERFITMEATHTKTLEWEAADRIEQLEAALRPLACTCTSKHPDGCSSGEVDCPFWNARAALGGGYD